MHKIAKEPENIEIKERELKKPDISIMGALKHIEFSPGIEQTIIASTSSSQYLNTEVVEDILKVEDKVYDIPQSETVTTFNFKNFVSRIKERMIQLFLAFLPLKKKGKFRKDNIDSHSKKALVQFQHLASLYAMYCHSEEEMIAFEMTFDKIYYDLVTHSKNNGYDETFFKNKMKKFVSVFEP